MRHFSNIEQLIELARRDPEQLENLRQQEVEALIASAPEHMQRRLRGLQFQIDCKRQAHQGSPLGACMAITDMMLESLQRLNSVLQGVSQGNPAEMANENQKSVVIPFPKADKSTYLHVQ